MSTELIPQESFGDQSLVNFNINDLASSFLPQLRLCTASSDACKEGKIPVNRWGLFRDTVIDDLGGEINVVICAGRLRAHQKDPALSVYDTSSDLFKEIQIKADSKDLGYMWGPEWLIWIPDRNTFAVYFMCSPTARREAPNVEKLVRKGATLKWKLIDPPASPHKWVGPVVLPCSLTLSIPSVTEIMEQVTKFLNPPKTEVKLAEEDSRER